MIKNKIKCIQNIFCKEILRLPEGIEEVRGLVGRQSPALAPSLLLPRQGGEHPVQGGEEGEAAPGGGVVGGVFVPRGKKKTVVSFLQFW